MKVLALETATKVCSVAILENNKVLIEKTVNSSQNHSEVLLDLIQDALNSVNLMVSDIDEFAISSGPGSFTGLRVACATAKAFAFTENACVYEVSTLDSLAYNAIKELENATIIPIIDARRNQVYFSIYELNNATISRKIDYNCIDFVEVLELAKAYENVVFVGDGVEIFKSSIIESGFKTLTEENINAKASSLVVGFKEENKRNFKSLKLFYFKKSQAERELEEKLQKQNS